MNTSVREANDDPRDPSATSGTLTGGVTEAPSARFPVIEGPYLRDLLDQPVALQRAVDGLAQNNSITEVARELAAGKFRRVVLTGMGSSLHALYPLHLALSRQGVASFWLETAELLLGFDGLYRPDTLLVAVSQSGESAEIVNLLRRAGEFGHILGVTNNPLSRLGRASGATLLLHAGVESTVSCKSYLTTLAVLHWLRSALLQGDLSAALAELQAVQSGVGAYLAHWRAHVDELLALTEGVQSLFVTGRGESLATTGTAGLILKESTRHHAEGMSCAAFRHGPLEMIGDKVFVLVFAGDERVAGLNRRLVEDMLRSGGRAGLAATKGASARVFDLPVTPSALQPIVEILPVQMLSLALAARAGREAGRFERASKITVIE